MFIIFCYMHNRFDIFVNFLTMVVVDIYGIYAIW
jgi:hypothetical protein